MEKINISRGVKFIYLIIESINNEIRSSQMGKTTQSSQRYLEQSS